MGEGWYGITTAPKISYKNLHYHLGREDAEINSEDLEETLAQVLASHPAHCLLLYCL